MDLSQLRNIDIRFLHALLDAAPIWNSSEPTRERHDRWLKLFQAELEQRKLPLADVHRELTDSTKVTLADVTDDFREEFNQLVEHYGEEVALEIFQAAHDSVQEAPKVNFQWDLTPLNNEDIIFWECVCDEILDFSLLGRGVRDFLYPVRGQLNGELNHRGLKSAMGMFEL